MQKVVTQYEQRIIAHLFSSSTNIQQEVGDDLGVCVLNLLLEVNTLPRLVVISLVKVEI